MTEESAGFGDRMKGFFQWAKVVLLVVLITLVVVLLLQNLSERATVKFIVAEWHPYVWAVMTASFLSGVFVTLLVVLLRRGSRK